MTRRTLATVIAGVLTLLLLVAALLLPVPYVQFKPGGTVDMLAEEGGEERIQVPGQKIYATDGELHMTTVISTPPEHEVSLAVALAAWVRGDEAVKPYDNVYDDGTTEQEDNKEASLQMAASRDDAIAAALTHLGHEVKVDWRIKEIERGSPADGALALRDTITAVGPTQIARWEELVEAVAALEPGKPVTLAVRRDGQPVNVQLTPVEREGKAFFGVTPELFYEFPFEVEIRVPEQIGGPSAGLMFALSIVDTLTPGGMAGGHRVAGTGTMDGQGNVGPIGGIQQKIAAARRADMELFLAPAYNCEEAVGAPNGDVRVVPVTTLEEAEQAVEAFAEDPDVDLPTCQDVLEEGQ